MWRVFEIIGAEAPAIAAAAVVALIVGVAAFRFWGSRSGAFFDLKKSETTSTGALAVKIMAMSAEQNKTIASQCATIAAQQSQIASLRAELQRCIADCAKCHEDRARERAALDKEIAALKSAIASIKAA